MLDIQHPAFSTEHPHMSTPVTRVIVIRNKQGLHARPAEMFVKLASQFQSQHRAGARESPS